MKLVKSHESWFEILGEIKDAHRKIFLKILNSAHREKLSNLV